MHIIKQYNQTLKSLEISNRLGIEDHAPDFQAKGPVIRANWANWVGF